jgi:uncharacterized membrane protein YfcA
VSTITVLLAALAALGIAFAAILLSTAAKRRELRPKAEAIGLGAVTNFFDTLGIGSFATTTAWIKFRKLVPDAFIPATLNTGHALPTVVQAGVFLAILGVRVDPTLLASCIASAIAGAVVGARFVVRAPVQLIRGVVGAALLIAAGLYTMSNLDLFPVGGQATALPAAEMTIAITVHFALGALMAFGIGLYAPSLILLSLLGLDPRLAFPIMAGACAFLMPTTGFSFIKTDRIDLRIVLGITLGGIPATLVAALIVKELPIVWLRWGVVVVVLYASILLLRSAFAGRATTAGESA